MNKDACILVAQILPILLAVSIYTDRKYVRFLLRFTPKLIQWWTGVGVLLPLAAIFICVYGVSHGGLGEIASGVVYGSLAATLMNVGIPIFWRFVVPSAVEQIELEESSSS